MIFQYSVLSVLLLPHILCTVYYVSDEGNDEPDRCDNPITPCKTLDYTFKHYKFAGDVEIKFLRGSYDIRRFSRHCTGTFDTVFKLNGEVTSIENSAKLRVGNLMISFCQFRISNLVITPYLDKITNKKDEPMFLFKDSDVLITNVTFSDEPLANIFLINSNLSMQSVRYNGSNKSGSGTVTSHTSLITNIAGPENSIGGSITLCDIELREVKPSFFNGCSSSLHMEGVRTTNILGINNDKNNKGVPHTFIMESCSIILNLNNFTIKDTIFVAYYFYFTNSKNSIVQMRNFFIEDTSEDAGVSSRGIGYFSGTIQIQIQEFYASLKNAKSVFSLSNGANVSYIKDVGITSGSTLTCGQGYFLDSGICLPCPPGSYQENTDHREGKCLLCMPGTFSPGSAQAGCENCAAGTYCDMHGCKVCKFCYEQYSTSAAGASSCHKLHWFLITLITFTLILILIPSGFLTFHYFIRRRSRTRIM